LEHVLCRRQALLGNLACFVPIPAASMPIYQSFSS
jgi:hypothetical protein